MKTHSLETAGDCFTAWVAAIVLFIGLGTQAQAALGLKVVVTWVKIPEIVQVQDINPGSSSSNPRALTTYSNALYFQADDGVNGNELWKYDGNTLTLIDTIPGPNGSSPWEMEIYKGELFFAGSDSVHSHELWKYDGNTAALVADIVPGPNASWPYEKEVYNGTLYFNASDSVHGRELWRWDGNSATMVDDILPGWKGSNPSYLTVHSGLGAGTLYFVAENVLTSPEELWRISGTTLSKAAVIPNDESGSGLTVYQGQLYLKTFGDSLYRFHDQTGLSPVNFAAKPYGSNFVTLNDRLYFAAVDDVHGVEVWQFDGQSGSLAYDVWPGDFSSFPNSLAAYEGQLHMSARDENAGRELFQGNHLLKDINPGAAGSDPNWLTVYDGALYFSADDGTHGRELWCLGYTTWPRIYAEIEDLFDKWWQWPVDLVKEMDPSADPFVTAGFLAIAPDEEPRLLVRHSVDLRDKRTLPQPFYESPHLNPEGLPPGLALVSVLFHETTGEVIGSQSDFLSLGRGAELGAETRNRLETQANTLLENLTLQQLREMDVRDFATASPAPPEPPSASGFKVSPLMLGLAVVVLFLVFLLGKASARRS